MTARTRSDPAAPPATSPVAVAASAVRALTIVAPAKVNLALEVEGLRPDGFHGLRSVLAPLALSDELTARLRKSLAAGSASLEDRLKVRGAKTGPLEENLVLRAAAALRADMGRQLPALDLELRKRIPVAAGLGGGSSDAAAALDLAATLWGLRLPSGRLRRIAASVGSDVPFFVLRGWALVGGRGERVRALPAPQGGPLGVLLFTPEIRLSTGRVFATYDASLRRAAGRAPRRRGGGVRSLVARIRAGATAADLADLAPVNDLWGPAASLLPGLRQLRANLATLLDRPVHMSGSGPTLFVLYPRPEDARRAARAVEAALEGSDRAGTGATRPTIIATQTLGGE